MKNILRLFWTFLFILILSIITPTPSAQSCTDIDGDGYGNPGDATCANGSQTDCDDNNPAVNPGATEVCDGVDTNCDGALLNFLDVDNDGDGVAWCAGDCNDNDPNTYPGATEICDGQDNDCVGGVPVDERDLDKDGVSMCEGDCNDGDASIYPGNIEICSDNKDNNCDGQTDEAGCICPDSDGDTYTSTICGGTDCDDSNPAINPGASETCDDGIDNDCNGLIDCSDGACSTVPPCDACTDNDGDGYSQEGGVCGAVDCDDTNPNINPGADEICDGLDTNCDGYLLNSLDVDADGDGVPWCAGDCNDNDPDSYPGATEICDGKDNDCAGGLPVDERDIDGDGVSMCGGDCNDVDPARYPGNTEDCLDGIDNDCDGAIDYADTDCTVTCVDNDGDGYGNPGDPSCPKGAAEDCNDSDLNINPEAADINCDGIDNNCSGTADEGYSSTPTNCGTGACGATGQLECQSGSLVDTCTPGLPGSESCNGIDDDCDGVVDNGTVSVETYCGMGVCASIGAWECQGGVLVDTCIPGSPTETPEVSCSDSLDNDCDGLADGADTVDCPTCTPTGSPDDNCDGIDDDCNGTADDAYVSDTSCGMGVCASPNNTPSTCVGGVETLCQPGPQNETTDVTCDGLDGDCDGQADEDYVITPTNCGTGVCAATGQLACQSGIEVDTCTPGSPTETPEVSCSDGQDNDCDNLTDNADTDCGSTCIDLDGDGYGNPGDATCANGSQTDCDDNNPAVNPGATEVCDGVDTNCDGALLNFLDVDNDGDGVAWCAGDCNDNDPNTYPGATEICDGLDNDCVGGIPVDERDIDKDGVSMCQGDCNDGDAAIYPGNSEICADNKDNNCNGQTDEAGCICPDADGDTYTASFCGGTDCDDNNSAINSGVSESCSDGIDNDCNGLVDCSDGSCSTVPPCDACTDADGDSYNAEGGVCGAVDCDDNDPNVYPGATEICDGKDSDCNGTTFGSDVDSDGDGVPWCGGDCDDNDSARYPGAFEICDDGIDNDCDNQTDLSDSYDCGPPTCGTETSPKDPPHLGTLLNPDDTVHPDNAALLCGKCHDAANFNGTQEFQCQRCHADPADASDPLNGVLKVQYPNPWPYGFGSAMNVIRHSSTTVGTQYGNWDVDCVICHNPHTQEQNNKYRTSYGKLAKRFICFDNQATGATTLETIQFINPTGTGSFADGPPFNENICEVCHTQTNHHRIDGQAPGDLDINGGYIGHNDNSNCMSCHPHNSGFKPTCGSCHDVPPATGTHLIHFGGTINDAAYGSTTIAQDVTSQGTVYLMNCGNCHPMDPANHMNGVVNSGGGTAEIELYNPSAPGGSLKALNPATATYTPGGTLLTDTFGMEYSEGSCSNVYCHSYTETSTSGAVPEPTVPPFLPPLVYNPPWEGFVVKTRLYQNPTWGVDTLSCSGCHEYPIINEYPAVSGGAGDSHGWLDDYGYVDLHVWNMGFGPLQCRTCHYDTVRDAAIWTQDGAGNTTFEDIPIFNTSNHVNGNKDIIFTPNPILYSTTIGDVYHDLGSATYDPGTKTCSTVSCHKFQTDVTWGAPYRWWNSFECNVCHQK